ncbi:MAG: cytochrome c [Magnetospirillum sp.]|nr:cytochrome c [Magnetospirillum sp.]
MPPRRSLVATVLLAMAAAGSLAGWLVPGRMHRIDPGDPRQVAEGRRLYAEHCARCHGAELQGEPDWRVRKPSGELPAPPHDASGHTWHHSDEQLYAITKHGMARFAPPDYKSAMPAFVGTLSDGEIRAVIAYIKSTWPEDLRRRQEALGRQ